MSTYDYPDQTLESKRDIFIVSRNDTKNKINIEIFLTRRA